MKKNYVMYLKNSILINFLQAKGNKIDKCPEFPNTLHAILACGWFKKILSVCDSLFW